jgi:hypothetical protein
MKKVIGEFTVKIDGNESIVTVHKNGELMRGIGSTPATLDEKFKEVCIQVQKHVDKLNA